MGCEIEFLYRCLGVHVSEFLCPLYVLLDILEESTAGPLKKQTETISIIHI